MPAPAATASCKGWKNVPARLQKMQMTLQDAERRAVDWEPEASPPISLDHVTVISAGSESGRQNDKRGNNKVVMRFDVKNANWLSERTRQNILKMEEISFTKDGEIIISSARTRTLQYNIQDALGKLQKIIDAASYAPTPPSKETIRRIKELSDATEHRRLQNKKILSEKKSQRSVINVREQSEKLDPKEYRLR